MKQYFSLVKSQNEATINIYGDITSIPWFDGDFSAVNLSRQLEEMQDVSVIHVHISSYGGEVKEGLAIYNALRAHKAKVITYCDSFACSIASVIFMAGDERIMNAASLLMIHNAWTFAEGNADELRKVADDLEVITSASVEAYKARASISEEEIRELMDNETWIAPDKAVEYGFATGIVEEKPDKASQNAQAKLFQIILEAQDEPKKDKNDEDDESEDGEENLDGDDSDSSDDDSDEDDLDDDKEKEVDQRMISFFNAIFK
jgi:ATP-dependent Clp protease protease subunit